MKVICCSEFCLLRRKPEVVDGVLYIGNGYAVSVFDVVAVEIVKLSALCDDLIFYDCSEFLCCHFLFLLVVFPVDNHIIRPTGVYVKSFFVILFFVSTFVTTFCYIGL